MNILGWTPWPFYAQLEGPLPTVSGHGASIELAMCDGWVLVFDEHGKRTGHYFPKPPEMDPIITAELEDGTTITWEPGEEMPYAIQAIEEFLGPGVVS